MPAATTHAEFAKRLLDVMPQELKASITSMPMYYLGSQGPDIFFFHKYMFLPGSLHHIGSLMHNERPAETIRYLTSHASSPALCSYVMGFITHYALDSSCHPIINAYSRKIAEETGVPESEAHFVMEGEIDAWFLRELGRTVEDYNVYNMLRISREEEKELGRMYHTLFQKVYGINVPSSAIEQACHDSARITRQLKVGRKAQKCIYLAESIVRAPHLVTGMILADKADAVPAVLNPDHEVWNYFGESNRSFPELMNEAERLALKLMKKPDPSLCSKDFCGRPLPKAIL